MIGENVNKQIDKARRFGEQLEGIVVSRKQFPAGDRNLLLIAYWALMFDYHKGILSLVQSEFFGAAFALVRPIIEANVRAHIALKGSEGDLRRIQNDEYTVNFKQIGAQIDAQFGLDHLMAKLPERSKALSSQLYALWTASARKALRWERHRSELQRR